MNQPEHRRQHNARALAVLALAAGLTGCLGVTDTQTETYSTARVQVTGSSPVPLLLVTSDDFRSQYDPVTGYVQTVFAAGDTAVITTLPADTTVSIAGTSQFLIRLANPDTAKSATIRLIVRLDDKKEVYNVGAKITGAYLEYTFYQ